MKRKELKGYIFECINELAMLEEMAKVDDAYKAFADALKKSKDPAAKKQLAALKKLMGSGKKPITKKKTASTAKPKKKVKMKTGPDGTYGYRIRGCGTSGMSGC